MLRSLATQPMDKRNPPGSFNGQAPPEGSTAHAGSQLPGPVGLGDGHPLSPDASRALGVAFTLGVHDYWVLHRDSTWNLGASEVLSASDARTILEEAATEHREDASLARL